jgi:hypothetical protein
VQSALALLAVAFSSAVVLVVVARRAPLAALRPAAATLLEGLGAGLLLFLVNVTLAALVVLASRRLGLWLSLYAAADVTLLVLSLLQGLTLVLWLRAHGPFTKGPR